MSLWFAAIQKCRAATAAFSDLSAVLNDVRSAPTNRHDWRDHQVQKVPRAATVLLDLCRNSCSLL
jgi:hypothetical protein